MNNPTEVLHVVCLLLQTQYVQHSLQYNGHVCGVYYMPPLYTVCVPICKVVVCSGFVSYSHICCTFTFTFTLLELLINMDGGSLLLSLQVWDGVSNRCISVFPKAHAGAEVWYVVGVDACVHSVGIVRFETQTKVQWGDS